MILEKRNNKKSTVLGFSEKVENTKLWPLKRVCLVALDRSVFRMFLFNKNDTIFVTYLLFKPGRQPRINALIRAN